MLVAHSDLLLAIKSYGSSHQAHIFSIRAICISTNDSYTIDQRSKAFFRLFQTAMKTLAARGGGFGMELSQVWVTMKYEVTARPTPEVQIYAEDVCFIYWMELHFT